MTPPTPDQDVSLGEVFRLLQRVDKKVSTLHDIVWGHEKAIAVLEDRVTTSRVRAGKIGAGVGGGVSMVIAIIYNLMFGK